MFGCGYGLKDVERQILLKAPVSEVLAGTVVKNLDHIVAGLLKP